MIRSLLFTTVLFVSVLPYAVVVIVARLFGRHASFVVASAWVRHNLWACQKICGLGMEVEGHEHIPATPGVALLKHSSAYETLGQFAVFPDQTWVLKRELIQIPFFGWAVACLDAIAIDRDAGRSAVDQVVERGTQRLREGLWVVIFPEGTRMAPGKTRRYGVSGVLLAQRAGVSITPVAHNAGTFWPRRGLRKKPGTIRFIVGPPVDPAGRDPREVNAEVQAWIEARVAELD